MKWCVFPFSGVVRHTETMQISHRRHGRIFCRYWRPARSQEGDPDDVNVKGLMFLAHGFGEHSGWYEELGSRLASHGILAFAHDHSGHGQSAGERSVAAIGLVVVVDLVVSRLQRQPP